MSRLVSRFFRGVALTLCGAIVATTTGCASEMDTVAHKVEAPQIRAATPVPESATSITVDDVHGEKRTLRLGERLQEERPGAEGRYVYLYDLLDECHLRAPNLGSGSDAAPCALKDDSAKYWWFEQHKVLHVDKETIFTLALVGGFTGAVAGLGYCTAECHPAGQVLSVAGLGVLAAVLVGSILVFRRNPDPSTQ